MDMLKEFEALDEKYCSSYKIASPPSTLEKDNETEVLLWVYGDMERLINQCRVRKFIIPFDEGGVTLTYTPIDVTKVESASRLLSETQQALYSAVLDDRKKIEKERLSAVESQQKIQELLMKISEEELSLSEDPQALEELRERRSEWKKEFKKLDKKLATLAETRWLRLKEIAEWEQKIAALSETYDIKMRKAYNSARAGINKILEEYREIGLKYPVVLNIMHGANNYSKKDPVHNADARGIYENVRRAIVPRGVLGRIGFLIQTMDKVAEMRRKSVQYLDIWNSVVSMKDMAIKLGWTGITLDELYAMISLQGLNKDMQVKFIQYVKLGLLSRKSNGGIMDIRSDSGDDDRTSIGDDSEVDYLTEIGTFLHDYIRESNQVSKMMSHTTSNTNTTPGKRFGIANGGKNSNVKDSKEVLTVQEQSSVTESTSGNNGGNVNGTTPTSTMVNNNGGNYFNRSRLCNLYSRDGHCRYGDKCKFLHEQGKMVDQQVDHRNIGYVGVKMSHQPLVISQSIKSSTCDVNHVRVAIDSQSGVNLTMNRGLCDGVRVSDHALHLSGVGGSVVSELEGSMMVNGQSTTFSIIEDTKGNKEIPTIFSVGKYLREGPGEKRFVFMSKDGGLRGALSETGFNAVEQILRQSEVHGVSLVERDVFNEYWPIPGARPSEAVATKASCESDCVCCDVGECVVENELNAGDAEPADGGEVELGCAEGLFGIEDEADVSGCVFKSVHYVKFGCRPIYHDSVDEAVGYLAHCGLSKEALCSIVRNNSVMHFPRAISEKTVKLHFKEVGLPLEQEVAQMTKARLAPSMESERSNINGEVFQLDACEPDFSKLRGENRRLVRSCSGFTKAVIVICEASGYCAVEGMKHNEAKHDVLKRIILEIRLKFPNVKKIKADSEWWSAECRELYLQYGIVYESSPTYDHRSTTGLVESTIRRMQDLGQLNMNNLDRCVEDKVLSEFQRAQLWFHALQFARVIMLFYPAYNDESKTRFEIGFGRKPDLNHVVVMPFGANVVTRVPSGSGGRGSIALYIGPSLSLRGGINVFNVDTRRVQSSWSFKPVNVNNTISDINIERVSNDIYSSLEAIKDAGSKDGGAIQDSGLTNKWMKTKQENNGSKQVADELPVKEYWSSDVYLVCDERWEEHQQVFTIECANEDAKYNDSVRPLKPIIPKRSEVYKYPRWREAIKREVEKLFKAGTLKKRDYSVTPSVIMELIPVFEYKWKMNPTTGEMCWLECCRIVINGSTDTREHDNVYAETPDQAIVLASLDLSAKCCDEDESSDAARAYLQAEQTEEGVVVTPCSVLKRNGLSDEQYDIGTALYGDRLAALQWQMKAEKELLAVGCEKCISTRSSYVKLLGDDDQYLIRIVRHSDDFLFSGVNDGCRNEFNKFITELRSKIVMEQPKQVKHLLGFEIKRIDENGSEVECGQFVLLTMKAKIERLYLDFKELVMLHNDRNKVRMTPCHQDIMRKDDENSTNVLDKLLDESDHAVYRSVLGKLMYISISYRHDIRFTTFALSLRSSKPRVWDLKCALWCVEYLYLTRDLPLVLGGIGNINAITYSDATLGTAYEGRSVRGHFFRLSENSGAIFASVHCLKCAVKSVFHPELASCADGIDTSMFMCNVLSDFHVGHERKTPIVYCDNEAVVNWLNGDKYNVKTRGLDTLFYSVRHLVQEELVQVVHVDGVTNPSDVLTKILPSETHWKHTKNIMGLHLLTDVPKYRDLLKHEEYFCG